MKMNEDKKTRREEAHIRAHQDCRRITHVILKRRMLSQACT